MYEIVMSGFDGGSKFTHKCSTFAITDDEIVLHGDCLTYRYSRKYYELLSAVKSTDRRNDGSNQEKN